MGFLPSCGCVNTTVWMHHMDPHKAHEEKARRKLHNAICCFQQFLEITPNETAAVWPFTSQSYKTSKMNKTCKKLLEKQG